MLGKKGARTKKVLNGGLWCCAYIALGFQMAAALLCGQSLRVFAHGPVYLATIGLVSSPMLVGLVIMVAMSEGTQQKAEHVTRA